MALVRPIRTDADYEAALDRIEELLNQLSGEEGQVEDTEHPARVELDVLSDLVELYEGRTVEIGYPDPVAAIEFRMDQTGLTPRDLVPFIGSRAKVSEVLTGKRAITMSMARALHQHLGIPADILLGEQRASATEAERAIDWDRFPLRAMVKAEWIPDVSNLKERAEELVSSLMSRAGGSTRAGVALYRKSDSQRINAKSDDYALQAWCWQVMAQAREQASVASYAKGAITQDFLRTVARLSVAEDGPQRARQLLHENGIGFEVVHHLPRTYLDGAAFMLPDRGPVVGLTLRYDRIDNFWFTLLHELAHIGLHLDDDGEETVFIDDLSLRGLVTGGGDSKEEQADDMAEEALIPWEAWEESAVREDPTPMRVMSFAQSLGIHAAIVAGRVRFERGNYRLLSQFVGSGEVRWQFEDGQRATAG